jgi:hypothetical protein
MIITDIPAGEQVLLCNLGITPDLAVSGAPAGFEVVDCAGDVVFEDCVVLGVFSNLAYTMTVDNCANVVFRGCELFMVELPLDVTDSHVVLTTTSLYQLASPPVLLSPPGLRLTDSTATMIGSLVWGGYGPQGYAPGAQLFHSTLRVGPYSQLEGTTRCCSAPNQDSQLFVDPRSWLVGTPHLIQPIAERTDAVYHSWIVANRPYEVSIAGPPGGFGLLLLGEMAPPTPTPFGELSLIPATAMIVDLVPLQVGTGYHEWPLFCPSGVPSGFAFTFQAVTLSGAGQFGVTVPSPALVAWEPGIVP